MTDNDLDRRLRDELDRLRPPDLAEGVEARLRATPEVGGLDLYRRRLEGSPVRVALTVGTALLLFAAAGALVWAAFLPGSERRPAATEATLGLPLFLNGEIVEVSQGTATVVAEWPRPTAPYQPPVETDQAILALAPGRQGVDLWRSSQDGGAERVAEGTSQSFAVSAHGAVAYGVIDPSMTATTLHITNPLGDPMHQVVVDGYAAPVGFVGSHIVATTGDGAEVQGFTWNGARDVVSLPPSYHGAIATQQLLGYSVLRIGDSGCWNIVTFVGSSPQESGTPEECSIVPQAFSPSGSLLAGIDGHVEPGFAGSAEARVVVQDVSDRGEVFRSDPIAGAYQVAWEDEARLLVLARSGESTLSVYRCDLTSKTCKDVWNADGITERYAGWIVTRMNAAPLLWPEVRPGADGTPYVDHEEGERVIGEKIPVLHGEVETPFTGGPVAYSLVVWQSAGGAFAAGEVIDLFEGYRVGEDPSQLSFDAVGGGSKDPLSDLPADSLSKPVLLFEDSLEGENGESLLILAGLVTTDVSRLEMRAGGEARDVPLAADPLTEDHRLFVAFPPLDPAGGASGTLVALDADGSELWSSEIGPLFPPPS
jgi:hypothetical protein